MKFKKVMGVGIGCVITILILSVLSVSANTYTCPESCPSPDGCMECDGGNSQGLIKFEFNDSDGDGFDEAICYDCGTSNYCDFEPITINITAWDEDGEVIAFEWEAKPWVDVNEIYVKDGEAGEVCGYVEDPVEGENITNYDVFCGEEGHTWDKAMSHITFCATIDEEEIPEFPTMAIPIAIALLGAMFFLRRQ